MTITRLCTLTWVAARPIPGAAYMVSSMSSVSWRMLSSTCSTTLALVRSLGSGKWSISSWAMGLISDFVQFYKNSC